MIKVKFLEETKKVSLRFYDPPDFYDLVDYMKECFIPFKGASKSYECSPLKFLNVKEGLSKLDDFDISPHVEKRIEETKLGIRTVERKRRRYDEGLLRSPVLGDFQKKGIKKMICSNRVLNSDEVGLGKTYSTISALNHLCAEGVLDKVVVVTLGSLFYNWKREILKFSNSFKEEDIVFVDTKNRDPFVDGYDNSKVIICSYDSFKLMIKVHGKKGLINYRKPVIPFQKWSDPKKTAIILDEAHFIKNPKSQRRKYLDKHKGFFHFRYLLTFTPFGNSVEESFALVNFLDDGLTGDTYFDFVESIAHIGMKYNHREIIGYKKKEVDAYLERINPYIIRNYKKDVLKDLPELNIKKIFIPMLPKHRDVYESIITASLRALREKEGYLDSKQVFNKFPYLSLTCSDVSLMKDKIEGLEEKKWRFTSSEKSSIMNWKFINNGKLRALKELIKEHKDEKIIIWSYHPYAVTLIGEYFKKEDPTVILAATQPKGMTKNEYRDREVEAFKADKKKKIIIMSPLILGTGVNLPQSSVSIYWDRDWSVINHTQSMGRNHRATSTKDVTAYVLIFDRTLEIIQDQVLDGKIKLNKIAVNNKTLGKDQWKNIFEGVLNF